MEHTAKLELPLVAAAQAQKHVTVNEALERLDALAQIGVASRSGPPPLAPEQGECRIVSDDAAWNGIAPADRLAQFAGNAWRTFVPRAGWIAHVADESGLVIHDGTAWQPLETGGAERVERLGIATDAEAPNLFPVASDAALLSHGASGDHRLVLNKERSTDTASLVFQTGYGDRAEMGTAGGDDFPVQGEPGRRRLARGDPDRRRKRHRFHARAPGRPGRRWAAAGAPSPTAAASASSSLRSRAAWSSAAPWTRGWAVPCA